MRTMNEKLEVKESSTHGDSSKGSIEGSSQGALLRLEAPQGANRQNPVSENLKT
jgi:hypothetical protein